MKLIVAGIILLLFLAGCKNNGRPDVGNLLKNREIVRFDKELFALDEKQPDVEMLHRKYGRYLDIYAEGVLQLGSAKDSSFQYLLSLFLQDTVINEVYDSVAQMYPDMIQQKQDLSKALAFYEYYFPDRVIPEVYTHISGFNQSVIVDSAVIGISLDNYLGETCPFYSMLANPIPMFVRRKMTGRNIVKDALYGWMCAEFVYRPQVNDLVSGMIYQGKILYLLEKIFPDYEQERLFDFSAEQMKWCGENESQIWTFLIENDCLFSTQKNVIMKYLSDAPFTSGMPSESPGRSVVWTGYEIVRKYMDKTDGSLPDLMNEQDYHKVLKTAGYRP